ncbi:MAG: hypothetical protein Kow0042_20110 [Calditrichia bacterium]
MKQKWFFIFTGIFLIFSGCLTFESMETHIVHPQSNQPGKIIVTVTNIGTTENEPERINADFKELLNELEGDQFLLDAVSDGIYIKSRRVYLDNNILKASYEGIFGSLENLENCSIRDNQIFMKMDADSQSIAETNGTIQEIGEETYIVWPLDAEDLYWKVVNENWDPDKNPSLAPLWKKYVGQKDER